tara:strand:- start:266 stop:430 length:165 start_codon:yes stop_codon:yes gene_type:complete
MFKVNNLQHHQPKNDNAEQYQKEKPGNYQPVAHQTTFTKMIFKSVPWIDHDQLT